MTIEKLRVTIEKLRVTIENSRVISENLRVTIENFRVTGENFRVIIENFCVISENLRVTSEKFSEKSEKTRMIVIGDVDVIKNGVRKSTNGIIPLGMDRYTGQVFGNKNFLLNCIDYLSDDSGLMAIRSK